MPASYNRMADSVYRALVKYGRPVILRQYSASGGDYNPALGKATPVGTDGQNDTIRQALVADQPGSQISQRFGDTRDGNTLVQQGEKWIYMEAKGEKPSLQDRVIFDDIEYVIIDVQELKPGLTAVFYLLVLRR